MFKKVIKQLSRKAGFEVKKIKPPQPRRIVDDWFSAKGDLTYRLRYDNLSSNSLVFDLGGYQGQWASDMFAAYPGTKIFVFEPVANYADFIHQRFQKNEKIKVFSFALGSEDGEIEISVDANRSSTARATGTNSEKIKIRKFSDFLLEQKIEYIDLIKINIEGAEYDLLEHIIESGLSSKVKNFQIQFHDFVPGAIELRKKIRNKLALTHRETWCYEFIWENWEIK